MNETVKVDAPYESQIWIEEFDAVRGVLVRVYPFGPESGSVIEVSTRSDPVEVEFGPERFRFERQFTYPWMKPPRFVAAHIYAFSLHKAVELAESRLEITVPQVYALLETNPRHDTQRIAEMYVHLADHAQDRRLLLTLERSVDGYETLLEPTRMADLDMVRAYADALDAIAYHVEAITYQETPAAGYGYEDIALGDQALHAEKMADAVTHYERGLTKKISDNTRATVHRRLGEICEHQGDVKSAIFHYRKALSNNPKVGVKKKLSALLAK